MDGDQGEHDDARPSGTHKADLALFAVYCVFYAVFMVLVAFAPDVLAMRVLGGVNLAVAYGMGLIVAAVAMAGIATLIRRPKEHE